MGAALKMALCKQITRNMSKQVFVRHVKAIYNRKSLPTSFILPTTLWSGPYGTDSLLRVYKSAKLQPFTL